MLNIRVKVNKEDIKNLKKLPAKALKGLFSGMQDAMNLVENTVKGEYLSGKALKQRTGKLKGSIATKVKKTKTGVAGTIGTLKYAVDYAAVWELGGRYPGQVIRPIRAKALRFFSRSGTEVFAMSANIPPRIIRARPYLMPAIKEDMTKMLNILGRSATKEMNK